MSLCLVSGRVDAVRDAVVRLGAGGAAAGGRAVPAGLPASGARLCVRLCQRHQLGAHLWQRGAARRHRRHRSLMTDRQWPLMTDRQGPLMTDRQ